MDPALAPGLGSAAPGFRDGLGDRRRVADATGETLELLCLRRELTAIPSFEFALRERASRLASFRHTYFGRVRSIERLNDPAAPLAVVSEATRGVRLSQLLSTADPPPVTIDLDAALHLIRQLVSAVAMLHENARDVAHGAITPERIIVTSSARVVITEYVLGAALEQLRWTPERYWRELRIPLPSSTETPRFDQRADVAQIGVVALSLVLGRMLTADEYPARVADIVQTAQAVGGQDGEQPLPPGVRAWLRRALQLDPRTAFASAFEAQAELDNVLSGEDDADYEEVASTVQAPSVPVEEDEEEAIDLETAADIEDDAAPEIVPAPAPSVAPAPAAVEPAIAAKPAVEHTPEPAMFASTAVTFAGSSDVEDQHGDVDDAVEEAAPTFSRAKTFLIAAAVVVAAVVGGGAVAAKKFLGTPAAAAATGTLTITTDPAGARVLVDNEMRGVTPMSLSLSAGQHVIELHGGAQPRVVPVTITAGTQTSQYIELPVAAPAASEEGQLQVRTEPAGAQVTVDGVARGRAPLVVESLAAGEHVVVLQSELGTVKQAVSVKAGATASLVVPMTATETAPVSGWIALAAPVELQIYENKRLLGTSESDRIMVSAGKHELEIVNQPLGFHETTVVQVLAGKVAPVKIEWPTGVIAVNALPWAEVWIDGNKVGDTPIGNLSLPIGPHEITFRNPELGELKHAVTVALNSPARVSVDLRKKP